MQARIEAGQAWEAMRLETINRLTNVTQTYLQLHEHRCHAASQRELIARGERIHRVIAGRTGLDVARLGLAKTRSRIGARQDRLITDLADVARTQTRLRMLIGRRESFAAGGGVDVLTAGATILPGDREEWIPVPPADTTHAMVDVAAAMATAMNYRAEIKTAMRQLESSALGIRVSKNQLMPRLDAVLNGYLAGLRGNNDAFGSFGDQFTQSGPGVSGLLQYELPYRNRAARARYREAMHRYRRSTFQLQQTLVDVRGQVEAAIISIETADQLRQSKRQTLAAATEEEYVLMRRYELMGPGGGSGGGSGVAILLENLLEAQQRRTTAERALASAEIAYHVAAAQLQLAMGTVLINRGIAAVPTGVGSAVEFVYGQTLEGCTDGTDDPGDRLPTPIMNGPAYGVPVVSPPGQTPPAMEIRSPGDVLDRSMIDADSMWPSGSAAPVQPLAPEAVTRPAAIPTSDFGDLDLSRHVGGSLSLIADVAINRPAFPGGVAA